MQKVFGQAPMSNNHHTSLRFVCWARPDIGQVALNTDGSVNDTTSGIGDLIRQQDGSWIKGFFGHLLHEDILLVELCALLEG
ncbi:hypothetical protein SESBI_41840 [Sesbania bispinosa]|nr:hypothetical protein SESBI_41840 [Sesbania bispinosa]